MYESSDTQKNKSTKPHLGVLRIGYPNYFVRLEVHYGHPKEGENKEYHREEEELLNASILNSYRPAVL